MSLVAIDLGKRKVGFAIFDDAGNLVCADTARFTGHFDASLVARFVVSLVHPWGTWVCEWPQKYKLERTKHRDIEALLEVGRAITKVRGRGWEKRYSPRKWKGQVPKAIHRARIRKALKPHERDLMPPESDHDAWDAVGIGLFHLGRVGRGGAPR